MTRTLRVRGTVEEALYMVSYDRLCLLRGPELFDFQHKFRTTGGAATDGIWRDVCVVLWTQRQQRTVQGLHCKALPLPVVYVTREGTTLARKSFGVCVWLVLFSRVSDVESCALGWWQGLCAMMAARAVSRLGRVVKAARAPALAAAVDSTPATAVATSAFRELLAVREVTRRALHTSSCRRQDAGTYDVTSDSDAAASATTGAGTDDDEFTLAQRSEMWLLRQLALDQGGDDFPENPYTSRAVYSTDVVTEEENPAAHSAENVGQYYSLPADLSELFPDGCVKCAP